MVTFYKIGLILEGRTVVEGQWAGRVTGLLDQSVEIAMMVTPDGNSRIELSKFQRPQVASSHLQTLLPSWPWWTSGRPCRTSYKN